MKVILDTSFIISCIRKRIDFISQLEDLGFKIVVPKEVFQELKDLRKNPKESFIDRKAIDVAFEMLKENKVKKITLGRRVERKNQVDLGLIKKGNEGYYIATLDSEIKRQVPNRIVIYNASKSVGIDRS